MSGFNKKKAKERTEVCVGVGGCDYVTASQRDANQINEQNMKVGCKVKKIDIR